MIPMRRLRLEPFVWLTFSAGGVTAAIFLPILAFLFAFAIPLGWVDPDYAHVKAVVSNPLTILALLGMFVVMLVHSAHRFRYTLYDGLQLKAKRTIALLCYGGAAIGSLFAAIVLLGNL
jgi:fumarate reductase subunit D